jgi:hypothetical protein
MWNLFKAQLVAEYTPRTYLLKDLNKLGKHGKYVERLYQGHIDITSGGKLIPRKIIPKAFETYFKAVAIANRLNLYDAGNQLSNQLKVQHLAYWTGRVIDSPTAIIITLYPGIWTDIFFSQNFQFGARKWIDAVSMSMYLQKCSVLGVRISKLPPYIVTPWSGYCFKSLDGGLSLGAIAGSIINQFNLTLDLMSSVVYQGDRSFLNPLKSSYANAINSVLTPEIFQLANSIPNIYGTDFNGIDFSVGANNQYIDDFILKSFESICNSFNAQFNITESSQLGDSKEIKPRPTLTILTGVIGLDELKKKWIDDNKKGNATVIDYNEIRLQIAREYYETEVFDGVRIIRGIVPFDDRFSEEEFFQSEYSNYAYRYLRPFDSRPRYILFGQVIEECIKRIFNSLISGTSVIFNARNIEVQDRLNIIDSVKRRIETVIQTEFLEEFNLYLNESKNSYDISRWTNDQRIEYSNRLRDLKGVSFRNKIFFPDDLLTDDEKKNLTEDQKIFIIKERLFLGLLSFYQPKYFPEDSSLALSLDFLRAIINIQIQRFGFYFKDSPQLEINNIFIEEGYSLI